MKEKNKLLAFLNKIFKFKAGIEKLFLFVIILMITCHLTGCLWYFLAKLENFSPDTWVINFNLFIKMN